MIRVLVAAIQSTLAIQMPPSVSDGKKKPRGSGAFFGIPSNSPAFASPPTPAKPCGTASRKKHCRKRAAARQSTVPKARRAVSRRVRPPGRRQFRHRTNPEASPIGTNVPVIFHPAGEHRIPGKRISTPCELNPEHQSGLACLIK